MFFFLNKCHTTIIDKIKTININLFLFKLCLFYVAFNIYFTLVNKKNIPVSSDRQPKPKIWVTLVTSGEI